MPQAARCDRLQEDGDLFIYSDPEVEVICRSAHTPEDELYRYGSHPIPEEWVNGKRFGLKGDGTEEDRKAQCPRPRGSHSGAGGDVGAAA